MSNTIEHNITKSAVITQQLQQELLRVMVTLVAPADTGSSFLNLSILEIRCLRIIANQEGRKLREVAVHMDLSLPGVSRLVDRLVKDDLVLREIDPRDRRAVQLGTTEKSRAILDNLRLAREAHIASCTRHLPPDQLQGILESLRLLADAAEQAQQDR